LIPLAERLGVDAADARETFVAKTGHQMPANETAAPRHQYEIVFHEMPGLD
jgi:hypothetical protein